MKKVKKMCYTSRFFLAILAMVLVYFSFYEYQHSWIDGVVFIGVVYLFVKLFKLDKN